MSRLLTISLALLLLGVGLPLTAAAEENAPVAATEEAGKPEASPVSGETAVEESAREGEEDAGAEPEEPGKLLERPVAAVDAAHEKISTGVLATARWIDSFFADPRVESEVGETLIKVRFSLFAEEDAKVEYDVRTNIRLDLPVLEGRLNLLIAGDPEEEDDFQAITGTEGAPPELASADDNLSASLRYFLVRTVYRNISLRSGLRLRSGTPTLFLEPRYRQSVPLDHWLFRFTQRAIGLTDGTVGVRTTFDLERELRRDLFFRTTADGSWFSDEDGYFYGLGFSLFQRFTPRRVLMYSWGNSFQTRPSHRLEEIVLSVRYRQQIWRDWLFYEIVPQLSFPRERDFESTPGIFLRLEVLFGDYPRVPPEKVEEAKK